MWPLSGPITVSILWRSLICGRAAWLIYGGIIGGFICMIIFSKIRKASLLLMADTVVPGLLIGQIIGRWGNFFNREAFGGYSDGLLAMQIRMDEAAYTTQDLLDKAVTVDGVQYIQVQPTFLYESLWNLGVLVIILLYRKHKKFNGELFMMYLFGYGIGRFIIDNSEQISFCFHI